MNQIANRLILTTAFAFVATNAVAQTPEFLCKTSKHTIIIDQPTKAGSFRYRSWNLPKGTDAKPDMELVSASIETIGAGSKCPQHYYKFKTGDAEFEVTDQWLCPNGTPPESARNATGDLYVRIKGQLKSHYYCIR